MKTLILGDIHGRNSWKKIVEKEKPDFTIFIGDFNDSKTINVADQVDNFLDILDFKYQYPDKVVLLIGNHDQHYFPEATSAGSGYDKVTASFVGPLFEANKELFKICHLMDNYLVSHAGVSRVWCENHNINCIEDINELWQDDLSQLDFAKPSGSTWLPTVADPGGDNVYQSPLWIRPNSLLASFIPDYDQIVGHTQQDEICMLSSSGHDFYFIDALEFGYYVIYNDGVIMEGRLEG